MVLKQYSSFISLFFLTFTVFAQLTEIDDDYKSSGELILEAMKMQKEGQNDEALFLYSQINENDTNYVIGMIEKSFVYYQMENYEKVVETCKLAAEAPGTIQPSIYVNWGSALDKLKKADEAIAVYDEGIKKFPMNHLLVFNKAVTMELNGKKEEAIKNYFIALRLNPFHDRSHYRLGNLCAQEKKYSQALMCLNMYLLTNPAGEESERILAYIDQVAGGTASLNPEGIKIPGSSHYEQLDLIIANGLALSKKYKVKSGFSYPFIKQTHLLLSELKNIEDKDSFWGKYYIPFYKKAFDEEKFETLTNYMLIGFSNPQTQAKLKKHTTKLKEFTTWWREEWEDVHNRYPMQVNGLNITKSRFFAVRNGYIYAVGDINKSIDKMEGYWTFYNGLGIKTKEGIYSNGGKTTGKWIWYHDNGVPSLEGNFNNEAVPNGLYKTFYENGMVKDEVNFNDGVLTDLGKYYFPTGVLNKATEIKEGKPNGTQKVYHESGTLYYEARQVDGKYEGEITVYDRFGNVDYKGSFKDGLRHGDFVEYYPDGNIFEKKSYLEGDLDGNYTKYFINGKISEEGTLKKGNPVGDLKSYFNNGNISEISSYDESSKLNGMKKVYDFDGKLHYELDYKSGDIVGYRYFDKGGKILAEDYKKRNRFEFKGFFADGTPRFVGDWVDAKKEGLWKHFDYNGTLNSTEQHKEGLLDGIVLSYYPNGHILSRTVFKKGKRQGKYTKYSSDAKVINTGYYNDDVLVGEWRSYGPDGNLTTKNYYLEGQLHGIQRYYYKGKPESTATFEFGTRISEVSFDSSGNVFATRNFKNGTGKETILFANGKVRSERTYLNNYLHGTVNVFHGNGQIEVNGEYKYGERVGEWKWYFRNGQLSTVGMYILGSKHGDWKEYYEDGTISSVLTYNHGDVVDTAYWYHSNGKMYLKKPYEQGEGNGSAYYYDPDENLMYVRHYNHGKIDYFEYTGTDGKMVNVPYVNETGKFTGYFKNGNKSIEFERKNGWVEGKYFKYYMNGKVNKEYNYLNDDSEGPEKEFDRNGVLIRSENYQYGRLHGERKLFFPSGKLKKSENYYYGSKDGKFVEYNEDGSVKETIWFYNDVEIVK